MTTRSLGGRAIASRFFPGQTTRRIVGEGFLVLLLGAACALGSGPAKAQTWAKSYGGPVDDTASAVLPTPDGGSIIAGSTYSFGVGNLDFWVIRLNSTGDVLWQKTYGGGSTEQAFSITATTDGGFAVAGYAWSFGNQLFSDMWVLKLDGWGNVQWQWVYGGGNNDVAHSIVQTQDGGLAVAGYTVSYGAGQHDVWVLKLDRFGSIQWQRSYGGTGYDLATSIVPTSDGGFAVAGNTTSYGAGNYDIWVVKLNSAGDILWQRTYGGTAEDSAFSIAEMADGGFAVAGFTRSFGSGGADAWILRLNLSGDLMWANVHGGMYEESALSVAATTDGGYVVTGERSGDILLLKCDSSGTMQWIKFYGGPGTDSGKSIAQTADGGYTVAGNTNSFGAGGSDVWVLRLNSTGEIGGSCSLSRPGGGASVTDSSAIVQTQCQE